MSTAFAKPTRIRVLCVDDSALIRDLMREIINNHEDMEVVAVAPDPLVARDLIKQHNPDVLTLDVEMPRMTGLAFLERLMRLRPMPVLMVSSLTEAGSEVTLRALELGAVDFLEKPKLGIRGGMLEYSDLIAEKIRAAARARVTQIATPDESVAVVKEPLAGSEKVILLGASTGGTEAIRRLLEMMPVNSPAVLITQHMPGGFTRSFAERLDRQCRIRVKEAEDGERVLPGHVYVAPGDWHMKLGRSGANYVVELEDSPPVNRHRPSVDVLFASGVKHGAHNIIAVLLTGMGKDGAAGMQALHKVEVPTIAQDQDSCVVFGMPREAIALGAVQEVLPLEAIAPRLIALAEASGRAQRV